MDKLELLRQIRLKKEKNDTEKLLLKYSSMIFNISETLVDESKCHIDSRKALEDIKNILNS